MGVKPRSGEAGLGSRQEGARSAGFFCSCSPPRELLAAGFVGGPEMFGKGRPCAGDLGFDPRVGKISGEGRRN